ncbi:hypothetical protein Nepgr_028094 [Nepenthes gracilis]|uniref:Uncharacterized protein n=1 Tax=Nepenthes gracilis TaxID=150966 RepID=A0AAD3Y480_NEPGR|nr:hypothetical protein Nepgr_028094 [Nepenthes gracilis]
MIQNLSTRQLSLESKMKVLKEMASKKGINLELEEAATIAVVGYVPRRLLRGQSTCTVRPYVSHQVPLVLLFGSYVSCAVDCNKKNIQLARQVTRRICSRMCPVLHRSIRLAALKDRWSAQIHTRQGVEDQCLA